MATIRFVSDDVDRTVTAPVESGERRTLLAVATETGVPILFNCGTGDCGACLVRVETLESDRPSVAPLTETEKLVLQAMGVLTADGIEAAERGGVAPRVRLACQYTLGDEQIVVSFKSGLSS